MATNVNVVVIAGNLTREPQLRSTRNGTSILAFGIAVNERVKDRNTGEWSDRPNFFDVVVYGNRAESLSRFLHKGSKVTISGKLHHNRWETDDGQKRSKVEVVALDVELPPKPYNDGGHGDRYEQQQQKRGYQQDEQYDDSDVYQDDIPFSYPTLG